MKRFVLFAAIALCAALHGAPAARATDPSLHCGTREDLVKLLTGKPHFESEVLLLRDEMPGQGHRFDLYLHRDVKGRHSYSLVRTHNKTGKACIVSAGLAEGVREDEDERAHIQLNDENDAVIYTIVTCHKIYLIARGTADESICDAVHTVYGTSDKVASYGRIIEDHRDAVSWLE